MKVPARLQPLVDDGMITSVVRQLMSGKEAMVFVDARRRGAARRSTRKPTSAASARRWTTRRTARPEQPPGARHGEGHALRPRIPGEAWQSAEVDASTPRGGQRAGAKPHSFHDGVLLMELVTDDRATRRRALNDVELTPEVATQLHHRLVREVVRMLGARAWSTAT
jgi:RIO kinase 1